MSSFSLRRTFRVYATLLCGLSAFSATGQQQLSATSGVPTIEHLAPFEKLTFLIEWHGVDAGTAVIQRTKIPQDDWQFNLDLESAGLVTRLYRVSDHYKMISTAHFCAASTFLDAQEGKRHRQSQMAFHAAQRQMDYQDHDLVRNTTTRKQLNVDACTHDVVGALATLRTIDLQPGKTAILPVTDGKKMVNARVEAQAKEKITVGNKSYQTIRYEALLFDNVLYKRKGRLFIWITDDTDRLPVQMRVQLGFPIGTIQLQLQKQEK
jgi:hypothetical protein